MLLPFLAHHNSERHIAAGKVRRPAGGEENNRSPAQKGVTRGYSQSRLPLDRTTTTSKTDHAVLVDGSTRGSLLWVATDVSVQSKRRYRVLSACQPHLLTNSVSSPLFQRNCPALVASARMRYREAGKTAQDASCRRETFKLLMS